MRKRDHLGRAGHAGLVEAGNEVADAADGLGGVGNDEVVRLGKDGNGVLAADEAFEQVAHLDGRDVLDVEHGGHEAVGGQFAVLRHERAHAGAAGAVRQAHDALETVLRHEREAARLDDGPEERPRLLAGHARGNDRDVALDAVRDDDLAAGEVPDDLGEGADVDAVEGEGEEVSGRRGGRRTGGGRPVLRGNRKRPEDGRDRDGSGGESVEKTVCHGFRRSVPAGAARRR